MPFLVFLGYLRVDFTFVKYCVVKLLKRERHA